MSDLRSYSFNSRHAGRIVADREAAIAECGRHVSGAALMAQDSAANVFREALNALNVEHLEIPDAGLPALFRVSTRSRATNSVGTPTGRRIAMDGATHAAFDQKFPEIARVRSLG